MLHALDRPRARDSAQGFSLVELLMASVVTVVVLASAVRVVSQIQQGYTTQLDRASARDEARFALDWIARELRQAGSNPYGIITSACPAAGTNFLAIQFDPNGNGIHDDIRYHADINPPNGLMGGLAGTCTEVDEDVTISHSAVTRIVSRRDNNLGGAAVAMTDSLIAQLRFIYLDQNRAATANPAAVAFVQIFVTGQGRRMDPQRGGFDTYATQTEVRLRSR